MSFDTPILLLVFNRPDSTAEVMQALRAVRPRHLFVAADGPRKTSPTDIELCQRTRKIAANPDWECEVVTLFRDENLGAGRGESTAMGWFFDQVEEGILLEDDCVPSPSFFPFCAYLLERYRDDPRVASVGGNFFLPAVARLDQPYYFSKFFQGWGWASWRRTWKQYRYDLSFVDQPEWDRICQEHSATPAETRYWQFVVRALARGIVDTWDFQLGLISWREKQMHIAPTKNLVRNIGFRPDATHTVTPSPIAKLEAAEITDYRRDVQMLEMPELDSLTFYVRFLDSLTSPSFLQQALALDEHFEWVEEQWSRLSQGAAGLKGLVDQDGDAAAGEIYGKIESDLDQATRHLMQSRGELKAMRSQLAGAVQGFRQLLERLDFATPGAASGMRPILQNGAGGMLQGLRGLQSLLYRD